MEVSNVEETILDENAWNQIKTQVIEIIGNLCAENLAESLQKLYQVNFLFVKEVLVCEIINRQLNAPDGITYGKFIAKINSDVPAVGLRLSQKLIKKFVFYYNESDDDKVFAMADLISELFNYHVIHEVVILQILHLLLQEIDDDSLAVVIRLLNLCGHTLAKVSKTIHDKMYSQLENTLKETTLSAMSKNSLEILFQLRNSNYESKNVDLPASLHTHKFMLETDKYDLSEDKCEYQTVDRILYNSIQQEFEKLQAVEIAEQKPDDEPKNVPTVVDETDQSNVEFKKKFYLILKSSLSGDEAAHKILKERVNDQIKHKVVDVILKTSIQESTYSKFYGLVSERLLSSHKSWKSAFDKSFEDTYENCDDLEPNQLRIMGKLWGHIFSTDYLGFEDFSVVHLNEEESSPPERILLKFIFQELVADIGVGNLKSRLNRDSVKPQLIKMFPNDDLEDMRYSINYFTAIGLGVLTDEMREKLESTEAELKRIKQEEIIEAELSRIKEEEHQKSLRQETITEEAKDSRVSRFSNTQHSSRDRSRQPRNRSRTPPRRNIGRPISRYSGSKTNSAAPSRNRSRTPPRRQRK